MNPSPLKAVNLQFIQKFSFIQYFNSIFDTIIAKYLPFHRIHQLS